MLKVNEEPHSSNTVGLGTLRLAQQNQKSVPTVMSVGHVRIGASSSVTLITCTHSIDSCVHQSRIVHVRMIFTPSPQSFNSLSQYPTNMLHTLFSSVISLPFTVGHPVTSGEISLSPSSHEPTNAGGQRTLSITNGRIVMVWSQVAVLPLSSVTIQ